MNFSFKKLIGQLSTSSAEVIDNHLVLSFPEAIEPIVWRMSLDKIGSASFEVKQDSNSEQTKLILKPKKGTTEIIACFSTKKEAVEALMVSSKALQHSSSTPPSSHQEKVIVQNSQDPNESHETVVIKKTSPTSEKQKWFIALLGALIVIGLYYYLISLIPETIQDFNNPASATSISSNPTESTGVPVSADDFLGSF